MTCLSIIFTVRITSYCDALHEILATFKRDILYIDYTVFISTFCFCPNLARSNGNKLRCLCLFFIGCNNVSIEARHVLLTGMSSKVTYVKKCFFFIWPNMVLPSWLLCLFLTWLILTKRSKKLSYFLQKVFVPEHHNNGSIILSLCIGNVHQWIIQYRLNVIYKDYFIILEVWSLSKHTPFAEVKPMKT